MQIAIHDYTPLKRVSILLITAAITACATDDTKTNQNNYDYLIESNTREANDWRNRNIDYMADYHEDKAEKARHNKYAAECGLFDFILFDIIFNDDTCHRK